MTNEDAIKMLNTLYSTDVYVNDALDLAIKALEERPLGEWIKNTDTVFINRFNCSICGKLIFEPKEDNNFCSNCGAKMKGGAE